MRRSWNVVALGAALAVVLLWATVKIISRAGERAEVRGGVDETAAATASDVDHGARDGDRRARQRALTRLRTYLQGARTSVPREAQTGAPVGAGPAPRARHPRRLDPGNGEMTDRRSPGTPGSERLVEELSQRMKQAGDAAQNCLDGWADQDDSLDSGVMLAFSVDTQGLQEVWIKDRTGVPSGPLACIANAVYPIDWGGLTDTPIEVTVRVRYTKDGGAGPGFTPPDGAI